MRTMSRKSMVVWSLAFLLVLALAVPAAAGSRHSGPAPDAVLYEVTEDAVFLDASGNPTGDPNQIARRIATAQLTGWAALGTPLCPSELLVVYPKAKRCAVNAIGQDDITIGVVSFDPLVLSATGPVSGQFVVVVQGDNPTDGPEVAVGGGTFQGAGDLSPTLTGVPLGFVSGGTGVVVFPVIPVPGGGYYTQEFSFSGTFRLPFSMASDGSHGRAWINRAAFYLKDNGKPLRVRENERSIGWATVRLEINFE